MVMNLQRQTRNLSKGFTLIEVMVVVIIFGLLSALAAPSFQRAYASTKFRAGERMVTSSLRKARSYAVTNKVPFGVHFDAESRVVTVFKNSTNPSLTVYETTDSAYAVDTLPADFAYIYAGMENGAVLFEPNGSAKAGGSPNIILLGETTNMMALFNISILASTGRVSSSSHFYNW